MATQFIDSYLNGAQYVPTSSVSSIRASTDKERIDISLVCDNGIGGDMETFFSTSLYAFGNEVELADVGSLVEEYFRKRNKVTDMITIVFDGISMAVHFLYCEYNLSNAFDPSKTFFLASMVQRVHQDSIVSIAAVNHGSETPFVVKAVGHKTLDNSLAVVRRSVKTDSNQEGIAYFGVYDIIKWALNESDDEVGAVLRDVLYFSIEYAGIQKMCYIVPAAAYLTFSFRNIFNVKEFIDVVGIVTTKTDVSRDIAVCNGCSKHYDRYIDRTYQVETEALTSDEVAIFEQFVASHCVRICLDGNDYDVIITDHTCEPNTSDDALSTIKFTWRFAQQRPRIFDSLVNGILPSRRRIFDETFSPEYE